MSRLTKFLALSHSDRALLLRAWFEVLRARAGLTLLPFTWHAARIVCTQPGTFRNPHLSADRIAWAIGVTSRYVPRASCLTQALAAKRMLNAAGISSQVRFACGVDTEGAMASAGAHAWVESDGKVVLGGAVPPGLVALPPLLS
jgi:hypothetical protein